VVGGNLELVFNPIYPSSNIFYKDYRILGKKAYLEYLSWSEKLLFGDTLEVGQTPFEVISEIGKVKVIHYVPFKKRVYPVPVLIITPILSKPYILDLYPGLSFIEYLVKQSFDIYLMDFGAPDDNDKSLELEDYICSDDSGLCGRILASLDQLAPEIGVLIDNGNACHIQIASAYFHILERCVSPFG